MKWKAVENNNIMKMTILMKSNDNEIVMKKIMWQW
jgi:hypothetical protein